MSLSAKLIGQLPIRWKMVLVSVVPLVALLFFLIQKTLNDIEERKRIVGVSKEVIMAEKMAEVVHQMQRERGHSIGFGFSKGTEEKSELLAQQETTTDAIAELSRQLSSNHAILFDLSFLEQLPTIRASINALQIVPDSIRPAYRRFTHPFLNKINETTLLSQNPRVKNLLISYGYLLYGKEFLSELRTFVKQAGFESGLKEREFGEFSALKGKYEINLEKFRGNASKELAQMYDQKMANPSVFQSRAMIDSVYFNPSIHQYPFAKEDWSLNITAYFNILREIEMATNDSIQSAAAEEIDAITRSMTRNITIGAIVILLIVLLLLSTIRSIVSNISTIKMAAERLTKGDVDFSIPVKSKDEIGVLADSFNRIVAVNKEYSQAADAIGKGDYSPVVRIRDKEDKLGIALKTMKESLQKLSKENGLRTWLLTGAAELNDKIRGEKEIRELAQEVVSHLTTWLKGQIGAIYLAENNHLNLASTYAFHHRKENNNRIKMGQGLVGQAALEKKPIIFSEVPEDYVKINSGLGKTSPKNILVFPFLFNEQVKGVIEIGSNHEFSELDMQFLGLVAENIGIAFQAAQSRSKMKELLEETQRQAEELEAQQEELRQTNEELHEKTELLEKSEAELRAQQEELQQTNEELEEKANLLEAQKNRLEIAKIDVETKARELEVISKYKSEFLANMSHELRTPLNSILILSQLMAENKNQTLGGKEVDYARNIYNSGSDLLNLINEILDLAKVEAGKIDLEIEKVNMEDLVANLRSTFEEIANNKEIQFDIQYEADNMDGLQSDKRKLEQILRNLLSNAFKFTDKSGTVRLEISVGNPVFYFKNQKLRQVEKVAVFAVKDTGIGIPEHKQGIIFEAFQQADGSTKRKYGGTGLGLSISRELATALGGEIHIHSEEEKGSTFTLYLPLVFDASLAVPMERTLDVKKPVLKKLPLPAQAPNTALEMPSIQDDRYSVSENDKVVLILEDDDLFAETMLEFVRERGYKGIIAQQGNTGLSLARYYKPDAILLDMKLPVMDGSEVLRQLKSDPDLRHLPVQIISGYDRRKEGLELGAFDFMMKPIKRGDFDHIFDRIEEFVNKKLKKLLVIEDNKEQNLAIKELIGNSDVKSYSAYSGEEAFDILKKEKFDCIIIDLGLPDMNGFELLEQIKVNENFNKIPIIVYTGKDLSKEEASHLNKLANTVVLKTASSQERLLDETILFLHRVESRLPKEKQQIIRKLHRTDEVLKNKKVLVVDDDIRNIYSLTNALEEEGMRCVTAEHGKAALQMLKEHPDVDAVLMDVMMPEMDGYEATRAIRKQAKFAKLPIIALTAKAMKGDREKCLEVGMSDYIAKPVNVEQLLSLMRVWFYQ